MRRAIALTFGLLLMASVAHAHVTVAPAESKVAIQESYTLNVPTEGTSATVAVELDVPAGVEIAAKKAAAYTVTKIDSGAIILKWTVAIAPGQSQKLVFVARNPKSSGLIHWPVHQIFADGSRADWVSTDGGRRPAPSTVLE